MVGRCRSNRRSRPHPGVDQHVGRDRVACNLSRTGAERIEAGGTRRRAQSGAAYGEEPRLDFLFAGFRLLLTSSSRAAEALRLGLISSNSGIHLFRHQLTASAASLADRSRRLNSSARRSDVLRRRLSPDAAAAAIFRHGGLPQKRKSWRFAEGGHVACDRGNASRLAP